MYGLILDGVYGSGKSSIMRAIKAKLPTLTSDSCLFLSEVFTQRLVEHDIGENGKNIINLHSSILNILEILESLYQTSKMPKDIRNQTFSMCYLLESFHFNAMARHNLSPLQFKEIDFRLSKLGCKSVYLCINPEDILQRSINSTRLIRPQEWRNYLTHQYGEDDSRIAEKFFLLQSAMKEAFLNSCTNKLVIDTSSMDWDKLSDRIIEFWFK